MKFIKIELMTRLSFCHKLILKCHIDDALRGEDNAITQSTCKLIFFADD